MKTHIISTFDKNHLGRAIAFRESLEKFAPECHVWFLLLDELAFEMATRLNLKNTTLLRAEDINDPELLEARNNRTTPEFASTMKPAFLLYMMKSGQIGKNDLLGFMDVDFLFYQPPAALFRKMHKSGSIIITPHRFPKKREGDQFKKGYYNAGMVFLRNDSSARKCLEEWRKQCIDWCYLRYEDGKIGDQGYLSDWPKKYDGVHELVDKGVNLSTWNIENYNINRNEKGEFMIDDELLICYHFHGLKLYFDRKNHIQPYPITVYHRGIYKPCIEALDRAYDELRKLDAGWQYGTIARPDIFRLVKQKVLRVFS